MRLRRLGLVLLFGAALFACKQGEGDRCQIDSDCEDDLVCVQEATGGVCRPTGGGGGSVDAAPPADAPPAIDAGDEPDAATDEVDAAPELDAGDLDAG